MDISTGEMRFSTKKIALTWPTKNHIISSIEKVKVASSKASTHLDWLKVVPQAVTSES